MSENKSFNSVKEFHTAFNHPVGETPTAIPVETAVKRAVWTAEEVIEFLHASVGGDVHEFSRVLQTFHDGVNAAIKKSIEAGPVDNVLVAQMDALTDISYFNYGSFVIGGVDPQPLFDIVQDANMAKLGPNGKPIIRKTDGKIMKPKGWEAPEPKLEAEINRQIEAESNE